MPAFVVAPALIYVVWSWRRFRTVYQWESLPHGAKYKECEIRAYGEEGVLLSDGTRYDCDVVMFCTGSKLRCP